MYLGAGVALAGAAAFFGSLALFVYAAVFLVGMHMFVVWYEEPTLARVFGGEYQVYRNTVRRWVPRFRPRNVSGAT
jgi:protein-S-isoprenylcysteine O-methyltransferase Ste14